MMHADWPYRSPALAQIPLILSAIMWGCNTEYEIAYIDCLFVCVSAMTVTGLATINLSTLSGWQQTIIFVQMCMGSIVRLSVLLCVAGSRC